MKKTILFFCLFFISFVLNAQCLKHAAYSGMPGHIRNGKIDVSIGVEYNLIFAVYDVSDSIHFNINGYNLRINVDSVYFYELDGGKYRLVDGQRPSNTVGGYLAINFIASSCEVDYIVWGNKMYNSAWEVCLKMVNLPSIIIEKNYYGCDKDTSYIEFECEPIKYNYHNELPNTTFIAPSCARNAMVIFGDDKKYYLKYGQNNIIVDYGVCSFTYEKFVERPKECKIFVPNVFSDDFLIGSEDDVFVDFFIYDRWGSLVFNKQVQTNQSFDLSGLTKGLMVYKCLYGDQLLVGDILHIK